MNNPNFKPKPQWLKVPSNTGANNEAVMKMLQALSLHTVCEEANCPNCGECFGRKTATFMILGKECTRNCTFCCVSKGTPSMPDPLEPYNISKAVRELGLRYVVITSVTRDDLADGGAEHFAKVISAIKKTSNQAFDNLEAKAELKSSENKSELEILDDELELKIKGKNSETESELKFSTKSAEDGTELEFANNKSEFNSKLESESKLTSNKTKPETAEDGTEIEFEVNNSEPKTATESEHKLGNDKSEPKLEGKNSENKLETAIVEVLIPDFAGDENALKIVIEAKPDVLNHNIETVERLYDSVRPQAQYQRSLDLLRKVKEFDASMLTKSGIMLGLGETKDEVLKVFKDLRKNHCDFLTIGQYLAPSSKHHVVVEYIAPEQFDWYKEQALKEGFLYVASGPLVRSSYMAEQGWRFQIRSSSFSSQFL